MRVVLSSFQSKVARRLFVLFSVCSLAPGVALAVLTFNYLTGVRLEQATDKLDEASKALGMSVLERLLLLETEMKVIAANHLSGSPVEIPESMNVLRSREESRFKGIAHVDPSGVVSPIFGVAPEPARYRPDEWEHLRSGRSLLSTVPRDEGPPGILLSRYEDPKLQNSGILVAEIEASFVWGAYDPASSELVGVCALDQRGQMLFCPAPPPLRVREQIVADRQSRGAIEWESGEGPYLGRYWSLPLDYRFLAENWTIVYFEPQRAVLAPTAGFKLEFSLVILGALLLSALVSFSQIRRSLQPINRLREATRRIGSRDFTRRLAITSSDEFGDLAESFNRMAAQLERQFGALSAMSELDRAILAAADPTEVVSVVLTHIRRVVACDDATMSLIERDPHGTAGQRTFGVEAGAGGPILLDEGALEPEHGRQLAESLGYLLIEQERCPRHLEPLRRRGCHAFCLFPVFLHADLAAIVSLGYAETSLPEADELAGALQVIDQVTVALANNKLVDEQAELEAQLHQAQKLESLGRLAGGVAHDFNNVLAGIKGFTQMAIRKQNDSARVAEFLSRIDKSADMASALVQQLLAFSRQDALEPRSLDLNERVAETCGMLRRLTSEDIELEFVPSPGLRRVRADPTRIDQVLMNLAVNARDAMPEGGQILIETANVEYRGDVAAPGEEGTLIPYVLLSITDTGCGMSEETKQRIFEPFFTTKDVGVGTGLGLATVYGIVEQHGGQISVESAPGQGTTFHVYLPAMLEHDMPDGASPQTFDANFAGSSGGRPADDLGAGEVVGANARTRSGPELPNSRGEEMGGE